MKKIGILTFHYSNNYGAILQSYALQSYLKKLGLDNEIEIINYIPNNYKGHKIFNGFGFKKRFWKMNINDINPLNILIKFIIKNKNNKSQFEKFNQFRAVHFEMTHQIRDISELSFSDYKYIIVGSDQIWNPSQREKGIYFLNFITDSNCTKISYASDSTISEYDKSQESCLKNWLLDFDYISVRNKHSYDFVHELINYEPEIVVDPTLLIDFAEFNLEDNSSKKYILTYILGKEIPGNHKSAIKKIKKHYPNIPVYAIVIPTMNFDFHKYADKIFYNLGPEEWLKMFYNASFIYTDSYHGTLFALKFHKPFLTYYTEKIRSTRFIDLSNRYKISNYIVQNVEEIDQNKSLQNKPNFAEIDKMIESHKNQSIKFIKEIFFTENKE